MLFGCRKLIRLLILLLDLGGWICMFIRNSLEKIEINNINKKSKKIEKFNLKNINPLLSIKIKELKKKSKNENYEGKSKK